MARIEQLLTKIQRCGSDNHRLDAGLFRLRDVEPDLLSGESQCEPSLPAFVRLQTMDRALARFESLDRPVGFGQQRAPARGGQAVLDG